jgi:capsular polysaccharide export protein
MALPQGHAKARQILRVEDGFLRSAGLGAALARPLSWVFDDLGLHIDPSRPSRLEKILDCIALTQDECDSARQLIDAIIEAGVSKYNLLSPAQAARVFSKGRPVVLVPGQVEDDASIHWGAPDVKTNLGLLEAVRAARPDAHLIYKPHPDVVAGLRRKGLHEGRAARIADQVITYGDTVALLPSVDEVHVMTSLAGFEALLRGRPVTCWGQPFYAGWGLTEDMLPIQRRMRRLTIEELAVGTLIHYPRYLHPNGGAATALEVVALFSRWRDQGRQNGAGRLGLPALRLFQRLAGRV